LVPEGKWLKGENSGVGSSREELGPEMTIMGSKLSYPHS
jgi:hypothetical protein